MTNAGGPPTSNNGARRFSRLNSASKMAATVTGSGRVGMWFLLLLGCSATTIVPPQDSRHISMERVFTYVLEGKFWKVYIQNPAWLRADRGKEVAIFCQ